MTYAVAQLVKTLHHKLQVRWFDFLWGHLNFSLTYSFGSHCGLGSSQPLTKLSVSRFLGLKTLPHSLADCLEILRA
jgi:hypothetical protein